MYEELDTFERALQHFGTRVEVIAAMEMGGRISAEEAYQQIKEELKDLKKVFNNNDELHGLFEGWLSLL